MLVITQIPKSLEAMVQLSSDPNVVFLRYGHRIKPTGERHHKPENDEEKKYMVSLNWKMLDSMKISDMKEWLDDPMTAIVKFDMMEEEV